MWANTSQVFTAIKRPYGDGGGGGGGAARYEVDQCTEGDIK